MVSLVIALFNSACAAVGLEDAEAALRRGDYTSAIPIYRALSDAGDVQATVRLAGLYQKGEGIPRDIARAVALYKQAASQKNTDALYNLGNLYLLGEGVPQDDDWAFTYYRQAAEQGHPLAQKNVREFYRAAGVIPASPTTPPPVSAPVPASPQSTDSVPRDPEYEHEIPVEYSADELKAIDIARAHGIVVDIYASSPEPRSNPSTEPVEDIPAMELTLATVRSTLASGNTGQALGELEILASNGNAEAQFVLSELLATLNGNPDEQGQALLWLKRSAQAGFADAQFKLGNHYLSGDRVPSDEAEAVTWYRAAARQGHAAARAKLDSLYRQAGLKVPPL
ncbi:MAG: sel1 repeat family protein [Gammaproteobacteria bacterium]|nr:sel1 repeat family protein [Gammaproteobacteria bacterium]